MGMMECPKHGPHLLGEATDAENRACCPECLREEEYYAAKGVGRPLPCVGYEYTLDWQHLKEIERLEEALRSQYQFQESNLPFHEGIDSLVVLPGRFTEPLTIIIYYVLMASKQDFLLALIDKFYLESAYPQRRILFYEAERWREEIKDDVRSCQYLDGVLLREIVVA